MVAVRRCGGVLWWCCLVKRNIVSDNPAGTYCCCCSLMISSCLSLDGVCCWCCRSPTFVALITKDTHSTSIQGPYLYTYVLLLLLPGRIYVRYCCRGCANSVFLLVCREIDNAQSVCGDKLRENMAGKNEKKCRLLVRSPTCTCVQQVDQVPDTGRTFYPAVVSHHTIHTSTRCRDWHSRRRSSSEGQAACTVVITVAEEYVLVAAPYTERS